MILASATDIGPIIPIGSQVVLSHFKSQNFLIFSLSNTSIDTACTRSICHFGHSWTPCNETEMSGFWEVSRILCVFECLTSGEKGVSILRISTFFNRLIFWCYYLSVRINNIPSSTIIVWIILKIKQLQKHIDLKYDLHYITTITIYKNHTTLSRLFYTHQILKVYQNHSKFQLISL